MTPKEIKVSPNGRHFVDQDGKPFFYLGDTCWLLFQRPSLKEVDEYFKDRASKGFTVIQAYVIRGLGKKHPDGNLSTLGEDPFLDKDPDKPNPKFFGHMDKVMDRAREHGLVMGLVTAKSWHVPGGSECVFDEAKASRFGQFLADRYKDRALFWLPGGDSAPGQAGPIWEAMARGHREGSRGRHLVSYHGDWNSSSSEWFHKADWLDFNTIQSGHTFESDNRPFVIEDYALSPAKPTLDMEPSYENHPSGSDPKPVDSHKVRSQAYTAVLSGAAGHGYGALDLFWFFKEEDGPFPRGGAGWKDAKFRHWREALAYEGSGQMGLMKSFFEKAVWHKLLPSPSLIGSYKGEGIHRRTAAWAADGSFAAVYLPEGGSVTLRGLERLSGSSLAASWYDPRTGAWKDGGRFDKSYSRAFEAPASGPKEDWALILRAS